jgi:ABC-2 type transport system ATP-binding protein
MSDYAVKTVALQRNFGSIKAVDGLSLKVSKGSNLLLLGPNGAGKTTLLRILMGLIEPTAGDAYVWESSAWPQRTETNSAVAYVGDQCEPPAWATLALLEDLQAGASTTFDRALFRETLQKRGLSPKRPYGSLSKGQRKWALVSLALACRPQLILLDEPADGLDPAARRALYDALRDHVNQYEATAIVTTHVIADVERIGDDVAILDWGRLLLHAPLEDLRDHVRQVEVEDGGVPPDFGPQISILGHVRQGDTNLFWIKQEGVSDEELCRRLGPKTTVRNVGLEAIYLAIAEHRPAVETQAVKEIHS